ncbi:protein transport protein Sec24D [Lates japonicus]|uniref:Protein transport protein Sec24D n=1 Tax=Lates japonicus TaxID=270547 RepID=A0AAD3R2J5_LATJO|nr:protein transport protein Sec24D [Lates japonicus]
MLLHPHTPRPSQGWGSYQEWLGWSAQPLYGHYKDHLERHCSSNRYDEIAVSSTAGMPPPPVSSQYNQMSNRMVLIPQSCICCLWTTSTVPIQQHGLTWPTCTTAAHQSDECYELGQLCPQDPCRASSPTSSIGQQPFQAPPPTSNGPSHRCHQATRSPHVSTNVPSDLSSTVTPASMPMAGPPLSPQAGSGY